MIALTNSAIKNRAQLPIGAWMGRVLMKMKLLALIGMMMLLSACSQSNQPELQDFLSDDDCSASCWNGIQPGQTTVDELVQILDENNIEYVQNAMFLDQQLTFSLDTDNPLWPDNITPEMDIIISDYLDPDNNSVLLVRYVKVNVCLSTIAEVFGLPDKVITSSTNATLVYYDEGMEFFSNKQGSAAKTIQLRSPDNLRLSYEDSPTMSLEHFEEMITQDCEDNF